MTTISLSMADAAIIERYNHDAGIEFRIYYRNRAVSAFWLSMPSHPCSGWWHVVDQAMNVIYAGYDVQAAGTAIKKMLLQQ